MQHFRLIAVVGSPSPTAVILYVLRLIFRIILVSDHTIEDANRLWMAVLDLRNRYVVHHYAIVECDPQRRILTSRSLNHEDIHQRICHVHTSLLASFFLLPVQTVCTGLPVLLFISQDSNCASLTLIVLR